MNEVEMHPVQVHSRRGTQSPDRPRAQASTKVTFRAYEVYCKIFGPQKALITGDCRGGFGVGELVAFLYARTFPEKEWDARFHEALRGLDLDSRE